MSRSIYQTVVSYLLITVGVVIGAISVIVFLAPSNVVPGGATGIGIILNHLIGSPIGLVVLLVNIPIQLIAVKLLPGGWRGLIGTVYAVVLYSLAIDWFGPLLQDTSASDDRLLNALFGGVASGVSTGLIFRAGATFGGTSTLALLLQRRTGMAMSSTYLYTDTLIILAAGLVFGMEGALYAIVVLFVSGIATDYVMEGPSVIRTTMIITDKPDEVAQELMTRLLRGVTALPARGMYTGRERTMLYITVARSQVNDLRQITINIDPHAFIVIGQGHSAYGSGFRQIRPNGGYLKHPPGPEPETEQSQDA